MPLVMNLRDKVSVEQLLIFKCSLTKKIDDNLRRGQEVNLSSDYGPSGILDEAAEIALIDDSVFPYKTEMDVSRDSCYMYELRKRDI